MRASRRLFCTLSDVTNLAMALFYTCFMWRHVELAQALHSWGALPPMIAQETLLAAMFVARRPASVIATTPRAWFAGAVGTFAPLLVQPGAAAFPIGVPLQWAGFAIAIAALLSLRRSMGIVAANRGVVTSGAYRVVRHPMYSGHLLCLAGYLATYPSWWNEAVVVVTAGALAVRVWEEERLLWRSVDYWMYCHRVRWRLLPGVY